MGKVHIVVPRRQQRRMADLHFRKPRLEQAGNFIPGVGHYTLIDMFRHKLEVDIQEAIDDADKSISVTYTADKMIGWSSVLESHTFSPEEVESFRLNSKARGVRFKTTSPKVAPLTNKVTFVISIPVEGDAGLVESIYPGRDVGLLKGYVSARERVIFFDFNHPGESIS